MSHQEEAAGSPGKEALLGKKEPESGRQMENFRFRKIAMAEYGCL